MIGVTMSIMSRTNLVVRFKPAAPVRVHLMVAALMWTAAGVMLVTRALIWLVRIDAGLAIGLGAVALVIGGAKGWFVLRKSAKRISNRIHSRGDGRCIGGFISWKTWLLVAVMMGSGIALRHSTMSRTILGVVYLAIGTALLSASCHFWGRLFSSNGGPETPGTGSNAQ
jgi:hypothetical protein